VLRADGSKTFILPEDFKINADIEIFGKTIRVYDCDQYTREFYEVKEFCDSSFLANHSLQDLLHNQTFSKPRP
jgi:hypothetical protein